MKKILLSVFCLALGVLAFAQDFQALPLDPEVRVGQLPNGLTYYIRHNELPKQRAEFHIAQAVGATLEEDNQNGLAHFLEHMCFNGTEHFPGKGIIEYFESIGVNFGGNINAYTSLDKTVYRLSDVPTYREGIIDSALLVMHDWSCAVSLLGEEIDNERGVIREEWRTGNTASRRMWKQSNALMFPGTRYATRDVIGDTAVINNFSYDAIRAYYKKWYGPDLQAIIVVGDIDVDQIENKIKALWADVPERANRGVRPYETIANNVKPIVAVVTDAEAQSTSIKVICKHEAWPKEMKNTDAHFMSSLFDNLVYMIMNWRFQEIALQPKAAITGGMIAYTDYFPTLDAFYCVVGAKEGREKEAYNILLEQIEKLRRYGVTEDELERAKKEMLTSYENAYNERENIYNSTHVDACLSHFLEGESLLSVEQEYQIAQAILPVINTEILKQIIGKYWTNENVIVNITAPKKKSVKLPSKSKILKGLKKMPKLKIAAPEASTFDDNLVEELPEPGTIVEAKQIAELDATEWTLSNGIRVVIKPTEFKKDEINMSSYSFGGYTQVEDADLPSAEFATDIINYSGLGKFSMLDLQKALTGKAVGCSASINANTESVDGSSTVKDFETLLQLTYLSFTAPRRDEESFNTLIGLVKNSLHNRYTNPKAAWSDSISLVSSNHSPRTIIWNEDQLKNVSLDKAMQIYSERFGNPADFIFFFVGNINPEDEATKNLILTYLGGLKTTADRETFVDRGVRAPKGVVKNYFSKEMSTKTASNRIQYTSYDMPYNMANSLNMEMIGRILSTRYLESIREREGGSYGVGVSGYMTVYPVPCARLVMQFDTDPEKQEKLMSIIHEEVKTILENGPLATDLQKEKESMLKDFSEDVEKNDYWMGVLQDFYKMGVNENAIYEAAVNAITAETVQATLKMLVEAGNMFEVVMQPK